MFIKLTAPDGQSVRINTDQLVLYMEHTGIVDGNTEIVTVNNTYVIQENVDYLDSLFLQKFLQKREYLNKTNNEESRTTKISNQNLSTF